MTWAQAAWDTMRAAGLVWNSRRTGNRLSYLLFVDPAGVAERARAARRRTDLEVVRPPLPPYGPGLGAVLTAASARNITVVL